MARWNARFGLLSCLGFGIGKDRGNWIDWNAQRELSKRKNEAVTRIRCGRCFFFRRSRYYEGGVV